MHRSNIESGPSPGFSNQEANREMGGYRFQIGGPGTTAPPLATTLHGIRKHMKENEDTYMAVVESIRLMAQIHLL